MACKMLLNGYVLHLDLSPVRELVSLQRRCANNLNQVAIHANAKDGTETRVGAFYTSNPAAIFERMEMYCRLCQALNSLPEIQGRRIEAYYLLGISQREIAEIEGVSESAVNKSIDKGLRAMKKFLRNFHGGGCFLL